MTERWQTISDLVDVMNTFPEDSENYAKIGKAVELMKTLVPKKPIVRKNAYGWKFYKCPQCGRELYADTGYKGAEKEMFCDACGQAVRWEGVK